ncbi:MAG: hypothetical protein J1F31_00705 [Erysipelotrichales bacterium]|nr:hypothetical protein [Erysipelotrichales bacterium]
MNFVEIEQTQIVEDTIKSIFEGKVVTRTKNTIKIVYKNQNKLYSLIVEKISDDKILLGTLSHLNELEINKITSFRHEIEGYEINCQSRLIDFKFDDSLIEIRYDLILVDDILSSNILRIRYKN